MTEELLASVLGMECVRGAMRKVRQDIQVYWDSVLAGKLGTGGTSKAWDPGMWWSENWICEGLGTSSVSLGASSVSLGATSVYLETSSVCLKTSSVCLKASSVSPGATSVFLGVISVSLGVTSVCLRVISVCLGAISVCFPGIFGGSSACYILPAFPLTDSSSGTLRQEPGAVFPPDT